MAICPRHILMREEWDPIVGKSRAKHCTELTSIGLNTVWSYGKIWCISCLVPVVFLRIHYSQHCWWRVRIVLSWETLALVERGWKEDDLKSLNDRFNWIHVDRVQSKAHRKLWKWSWWLLDEPHYEILGLGFETESVSTEATVLPDKKTWCSFAIEHALFNQSISRLFLSFFPFILS